MYVDAFVAIHPRELKSPPETSPTEAPFVRGSATISPEDDAPPLRRNPSWMWRLAVADQGPVSPVALARALQ
jgi:hypothetical protein